MTVSETGDSTEGTNIVIFDGDCLFCSCFVLWVLQHTQPGMMRFTELTGQYADDFFSKNNIAPGQREAMWLVRADGTHAHRSTAVLYIVGATDTWLALTKYLLVVPRFVRDFFYNVVSKHRHKIFKKPCQVDFVKYQKSFLN